nr:hypothetical protein [uncultured Pedobacter sp.]
MLQTFTWPQFLLASLMLSLLWYAGVAIFYYRSELKDFVKGKVRRSLPKEPLPHKWEEDYETAQEEEDDLMGKPAVPDGLSSTSMNEFSFAERQNDHEEQLGLLPDFLEELKTIFNILEKEDGKKADFISLFGMVKAKYPKATESANIEAINQYIREHAPFLLSNEELDNLWD